MLVKKEMLDSSHPLFQQGCGNFEQVRLTAVFKDGKESPIMHLFGLQSKILAQGIIKQYGWKEITSTNQ